LPRSQLIIERTKAAIHNTGLNVLKFASRVADRYMETIAPLDRVRDFYAASGTVKSLARAEKLNGQIIDRYIKGAVKFPTDLEEAWVDSLPEPFRGDLIRELAGRYGLLGARQADLTPSQHLACLADVLTDAGRIATALAPIFADGRITAEDAPHCRRALPVIAHALADLASLQAQLQDAIARSADR
jgi:hypothetical protein